MDVTSITDSTSTSTASTSSTSSGSSMNQLDFMELMVAQLQNQDPLEPMESTDYSASLAQFSSLQQLETMNESLQESININLVLTQSINNTLSSTIIGKTARGLGDALEIKDGDVQSDIHFKLTDAANELTISIKDESGTVVRTIIEKGMTSGEKAVEWDGKDSDGNQLADGTYTFDITATDVDGNELTITEYTQGLVTGVRYDSGAAYLMINGEEIAYSKILEIGIAEG